MAKKRAARKHPILKTLGDHLGENTLTTMVVLGDGSTWSALEDCEFVVRPTEPVLEHSASAIIEHTEFGGPPEGVYDLQRLLMELPLSHLLKYRLAARASFRTRKDP